MKRCVQCDEHFDTPDPRQRFCGLSCAAKFRGLGKYERPTIEKVCVECASPYTLRREGSDLCRKCRKRTYNRRYVAKAKPWKRIDPEKKRLQSAAHYQRHSAEISKVSRRWYEKNKTKVLAAAEKRRRARGERPKSSTMSGPEKAFADLLASNGIPYKFRSRIDGVEFDFLVQDRFAVELHGTHHREPIWGLAKHQRTKEIDAKRREIANLRGIELFEVPVYHFQHGTARSNTLKNLDEALAFVRVRTDKPPEACLIP